MKELFPYHGEKILVTQEMCDHNGHMNTGSYTRCFDGCWGQMYTDMGFDDEYFNNGYSSFTLEENLKYFKEFLELIHNDKIDLDLNEQKQFFVGVNETLNGNTLNRVIEELFNYQNKLIEIVKTKRIGQRIPLLKTVIIDK